MWNRIVSGWLWIPFWWRFLLLVSIPIVAGTYVVRDVMIKEDGACLAYVIDSQLDQFALTRGEGNRVIAERQAEAVARIRIKQVRDAGTTLCPQSWTRWFAWSRWRYFFGSKDASPRWQFVYPIAMKAVSGSFQHEWPAEWECVSTAAATKGPRFWLERVKRWGTAVGTIGNMSLYCD